MGSRSLLQGVFLTQESNWGLLHCRQILYQLSYQGSPSQSLSGACMERGPSTAVGFLKVRSWPELTSVSCLPSGDTFPTNRRVFSQSERGKGPLPVHDWGGERVVRMFWGLLE